jgi:alpha-ketoglutarate-dependent taurine dioxygenase
MVDTRFMSDHDEFPLVVTPACRDVDIAGWAEQNRATIHRWLLGHRAILFRGFDVTSTKEFEALVSATSAGGRMDCPDESTPRAAVGDRVYESTVYPAHQWIRLHNEASYCDKWPLKIYFCCYQPAKEGGATLLADVRRVASRLPKELLEEFAAKGVAYARYFNSEGIGLSWQKAFWTDDRRMVETYCRVNRIRYEWRPGAELCTTAIRPAFRKHPHTGELLWFNHGAFFNSAALPPEVRDGLVSALGPDKLPFETHFGDGTPIAPDMVRVVLDALQDESRSFPWCRGDVVLLDNMTIAHGRQPFVGDRTVVVAMAEPQSEQGAAASRDAFSTPEWTIERRGHPSDEITR